MTEYQHQSNVMKWSRDKRIRPVYPDLKCLFHIKNETRGNDARQVAIDKAAGVKKGVPDLFLPVARGVYHGLFIEMKTERGRVSDEQSWWIEELNKQGYFAKVCFGWKEAVGVLEWYMSLKK